MLLMLVLTAWTLVLLSLKMTWVSFAIALIHQPTHSSSYYYSQFFISAVYSGFYCFSYDSVGFYYGWLFLDCVCLLLDFELVVYNFVWFALIYE